VLDLGCGTGILSLMAARAGARKVYAVDRAPILDDARETARRNGLDGRIEFIASTFDDLADSAPARRGHGETSFSQLHCAGPGAAARSTRSRASGEARGYSGRRECSRLSGVKLTSTLGKEEPGTGTVN
jgi:Methyltransferase domain